MQEGISTSGAGPLEGRGQAPMGGHGASELEGLIKEGLRNP